MHIFYDDKGINPNNGKKSDYQIIGIVERSIEGYVVTINTKKLELDRGKGEIKPVSILGFTYNFGKRTPTVISELMHELREKLLSRSETLEERIAPIIMAFVEPKLLSKVNKNSPKIHKKTD